MKFIVKILKAVSSLTTICFTTGVIVSVIEHIKGKRNSEGYKPHGFYEKYLKRPLDFGLSLMAMIVLWPVLLLLSFLVKKNIGSPVIFKQPRPGLNEEIFIIRKYRTMTDELDEDGKLKTDEERMTSFGAKLRSTSLDELPELVNILRGDMSIVGPRPQLVRDMVFMCDEHRTRHMVRPGLTGLAQVQGRNSISWEEKLDKDLEYCKKITFISDLKILFWTVKKVVIRDGITENGQSTALDYGDWLLINGKVSQEEYTRLQEEARELLKKYNESYHFILRDAVK